MFFVRIDDRYIHGQVGAVWASFLQISNIVIANDELVKDTLACTMQKLSAANLKVVVKSIEDGAQYLIKAPQKFLDKTLVLVSNPKDVVRLIDAGVKIDYVNIGHSKPSGEKKELAKYLNIGEEDLKYYQELQNRGIKVEFQLVPANKAIEIDYSTISF